MTNTETFQRVITMSVRMSLIAVTLVLAGQQLLAQAPAVPGQAASTFQALEFADTPLLVPSGLRRIQSLAYSPDGKFLATAHGKFRGETGSTQIWNLVTAKRVGQIPFPLGVCRVGWTTDGGHLVSSSWNSTVRINEFPSLKQTALIPIDHSVSHVGISPDGSRIVTAAEGYEFRDDSPGRVVQIWDTATGELIRRCGNEPNLFPLSCAAWSSSGKYVAAAGGNNAAPLRGEARLWDPATGKEISRCEGHTQAIRAIAFFKDDARVATAGLDATIRIWESVTGKPLGKISAGTPIGGMDINPDGSLIATATMGGRVLLWDANSMEKLADLETAGRRFQAVAFSPDGQQLAAGGMDGIVKIWDVVKRTSLQELPAEDTAERPAQPVLIAPVFGGQFVVVADAKGELRAIVPSTETTLWKIASQPGQAPTAIAVSTNRLQVLVGTADGQVRLHSAKDGKVAKDLKRMPAKVSAVLFSTDGKHFATGDAEGRLWIWDSAREVPLVEHHDHKGTVLAIGFSAKHGSGTSVAADGSATTWKIDSDAKVLEKRVSAASLTFATISRDGSTLFVESPTTTLGVQQPVWDAVTLKPVRNRNLTARGLGAAVLSADGSHLIATYANYSTLFALQQPLPPKFWESPSGSAQAALALSPDDRFLYQANAGGGLTIRTAVPVRKSALGKIPRVGNAVAVAVSPDGKWLAAGGDDSQISFWNLTTGELADVLPAGGGTVFVCSFSADGRFLATGTLNGSIKVWSVADRGLEGALLMAHPSVRTLAFSPDGRWLASGGSDRVLKVTDLQTWETATTQPEQSLWVTGLAFSTNGRTLYSVTGSWDQKDQPAASELTAWSVKADKSSLTLEKKQSIETHKATVDNVVVTRDSQYVITAAGDALIKIWNAETLAPVRTIQASHSIHRIQLIPNHQTLLAVGGYLGGVSVWDITTGELVAHYTGHSSHVFDIAALPDGSGLITAGEDDFLMFWPGPVDAGTPAFQQLLKEAAAAP